MEEEGEAGSVGVLEGKGAYENAIMQEDGKSSSEDLVFREDSNSSPSGEKRAESEGSVSQNPLESGDVNVENTPMLTPEKLTPEYVSSREILVPNNETEYLEENFLDHASSTDDSVNRQESIECRSFLESDDYSESAPTDKVSEVSTSVKNYSAVDDEGATPQFDENKEILGKESEDVVMEIAERLSQLRSIGKTAESARKYILESDTGTEDDLDSNDHMSDLLGPKRLDFEVIDFDQFGAQPPDLPLNDKLTKVNGISSFNGGKGASASTKTQHHARVLDARTGFEQEMKGLNDSPVKIRLKNTPEKKQLRIERGAGALELPSGHTIPRLCNRVNAKESTRGQGVSRDLDSNFIAGRTGNSKLRLPDSMKPKSIGDAPSGSPIRRSKSTMPDVKGSLVHEETRKRNEDLQQLTHMQAKQLEDYCNRVDLSTAQLEEQSRMHVELNCKLEAECGERLKSEAKVMMLHEMLPNVEEKLKNLCDKMLSMEVQLQEQVDLRNKLEAALERERQERMHLVTKLEEHVDSRNRLEGDLEQERQERIHLAAKLDEQIDFSNKLEEALERERQERMHFVAKLEEQFDLRNKLDEDLEQERQERLQLAAKLDEQVDLRNKLEEDLVQELKERTQHVSQLEEQIRLREELACKLEEEREERLTSEAGLTALREMSPNAEEKLEDLNNQVESLVGQLQEQAELRKELEEKLDQELKERMQHMEDQTKMHEDFAHKFEEHRDERLKNEYHLKELRQRLPKEEEKLKDLQNQVLSLAMQLQEQIEFRKELEERLDREREERVQNAVMIANQPVSSIPWLEEKIEFTKLLDEQKELLANQVKEAEILRNATEKKVGLLNHQVQKLEELSETMECVFSAKERAIRQTMWTVFQGLCLGMGLMNFIVSCRNPVQSTRQPT